MSLPQPYSILAYFGRISMTSAAVQSRRLSRDTAPTTLMIGLVERLAAVQCIVIEASAHIAGARLNRHPQNVVVRDDKLRSKYCKNSSIQ